MIARWLLRALGVLLLVAVALKVHGWQVEPIRPTGFLADPTLQTLVLLTELDLGLWFLSGAQPALAWLSASALFGLFALVSFHQAWIDEASCGCFGSVHVSPWVAFALDVVILGFLALCKPTWNDLCIAPKSSFKIFRVGLCLAVLLTGGLGFAYIRFGSVELALDRLRGRSITILPAIANLGISEVSSFQQVNVDLVNNSEEKVLVYGGTTDCSCSVLESLPVRCEPGERKSITVRIRLPARPGQWTRVVRLLTDQKQERTVRFQITGTGVEEKIRFTDVR